MGDGPASAHRRVVTRSRHKSLLASAHPLPVPAQDASTHGMRPLFSPSASTTDPAAARPSDDLVVVCTGPDGDSAALGKLLPSVRARAIHALVGDVAEIRRLRSGALVFVAATVAQVPILLEQTTFCDLPVVMRPPKPRMAAKFGVVTGVDLAEDPAVLRAALLAAGATEFSRLRRRDADGNLVDTRSLRVAFPGDLPRFVIINYERLPVRPYVHRPLQCFQCQRYGHGAAHCRSAPRCGRCSGPHASRDCGGEASCCAVCGDAHPAWSRDCLHRARACRIETIRAAEQLTYAAAVRRVPPVVDHPPSYPRRTVTASTQTDICPPTETTPALRITADSASQTVPTQFSSACAQTNSPPTSDNSTVTDPAFVVRPSTHSWLFSKDDTGGEELAVFPLPELRAYTALLVEILDERRSNNQKTTVRALTKLVLDRFFTTEESP